MRVRVLIVDIHADIYAQHLRQECPEAELYVARSLSELPDDLSRIDVLIAFGTSINDDVLCQLRNVKWIQSLATGVDHFLRCPYLDPSVLITSGRGIHGSMMREMTVYLMLSLTHDAARRAEDQKNHVWQRRLWTLLYEKTAVVVGIGVAGTAIGELLHGFGMKVIGVSRTVRDIPGFAAIMPTEKLADAVAKADFLVNVLPANPDNIGLFDAAVFARSWRALNRSDNPAPISMNPARIPASSPPPAAFSRRSPLSPILTAAACALCAASVTAGESSTTSGSSMPRSSVVKLSKRVATWPALRANQAATRIK